MKQISSIIRLTKLKCGAPREIVCGVAAVVDVMNPEQRAANNGAMRPNMQYRIEKNLIRSEK